MLILSKISLSVSLSHFVVSAFHFHTFLILVVSSAHKTISIQVYCQFLNLIALSLAVKIASNLILNLAFQILIWVWFKFATQDFFWFHTEFFTFYLSLAHKTYVAWSGWMVSCSATCRHWKFMWKSWRIVSCLFFHFEI